MGHVAAKHAYLALQERLDRMPIGAPAHRAFFELLEKLFTPEECRVAAAVPMRLATVAEIARSAAMDPVRVATVLDRLAGKGLVADLPIEGRPTRYLLNPTVVGFFEYSMMRVREDVDQKKVAELIWTYLKDDPDQLFLAELFGGETFIGRPLINEEVLEPEVYSEVLDWEKASFLIDEAGTLAEGICHCRHVKLHKGERCEYPLEHCLSLGVGAEYLIRNNLAHQIDHGRAREILAYGREHGSVQMADNVQRRPLYLCNCCKCCCEMLEGLRTVPTAARFVTSNYQAVENEAACTGCGACADACPINVIDMVEAGPTERLAKRRRRASVQTGLCLGCGVCRTVCRFDGITMRPVGQRVIAPRNAWERLLLQAVERGKLQHLLFDDPSKLSHRALAGFFGALLQLPPAKQALANRQLRSRFVAFLIERRRARRKARSTG